MNDQDEVKKIYDTIKVYTVLGDPLPLARARFGQGHVYDSQKNHKLVIGITLQSQYDDPPLTGPLHVEITFFMHIPRTQKKIFPGFNHSKKPDIDNLLKLYLDVCKNIFYLDDNQVASLYAKKIYGKEPKTEIRIIPL